MKKLVDKTIFITGGLSGIGKACAMAAAQEGANVVVVDMPNDLSSLLMQDIVAINLKAIFLACDVSKMDELKSAIDKTVQVFGSLDVALNNAGIGGESNKVADMTEKAWQQVIGINLSGVFNGMKYELIQMLKQKKGVIVNMSSILGKVGFAQSSHYVAAKHGVLGLTKTAALEYATDGIRINAICPGFIATPLLEKGGITDHSKIMQHIVDLHPMKRLGRSEEIAKGFVFLACDDSSFMTGSTLEIEGGYLAQ
ncbi:MAG: SDR family oxidoreductase [Saprospiraceae bacterium]|uniref:SDR family oxidoreductase n=1 Tax=Candidatus Defluviibacterium haderslevense TaxID=2981993 RepID=A0A9D7S8W3_9BACT|nr:SDR family oxidoreductase [Candidatus Defluviibacterium haderslevense]